MPSQSDLNQLKELRGFLLYCHISELREIVSKLTLLSKGKKGIVIERIIHFLRIKEKTTVPKFPPVFCSRHGQKSLLAPDELMLKRAYKNDLKTRLFFKEQVHFST